MAADLDENDVTDDDDDDDEDDDDDDDVYDPALDLPITPPPTPPPTFDVTASVFTTSTFDVADSVESQSVFNENKAQLGNKKGSGLKVESCAVEFKRPKRKNFRGKGKKKASFFVFDEDGEEEELNGKSSDLDCHRQIKEAEDVTSKRDPRYFQFAFEMYPSCGKKKLSLHDSETTVFFRFFFSMMTFNIN